LIPAITVEISGGVEPMTKVDSFREPLLYPRPLDAVVGRQLIHQILMTKVTDSLEQVCPSFLIVHCLHDKFDGIQISFHMIQDL
jgi:hypothetical protein